MKQTKKEVLRAVVLALILTGGVGYALADWVAPTSAPPGENTPPPINVGPTTQIKDGNFFLGAGHTIGATIGTFGAIAIGKTSPTTGVELDIVGKGRSDSTTATDNARTLVTKDYVDARSGFGAIDCGAGSVLQGIRANGTPICVSLGAPEVPSGAVMAFNLASCPAGWSDYSPANGRQIIGSDATYSRGSTGGSASHTLTIAQMPSHTHSLSINAGGESVVKTSVVGGSVAPYQYISYTTGASGTGQAYSIMDPYVALKYCRKN